MNYIIEAFKSLEEVDDKIVKVTPKEKKSIRESAEDYYCLSDGENPKRSHIYSEIADLDSFIADLEERSSSGNYGYWELLHYVNGNPIKVWDTKNGRVQESCIKEEEKVDLHPQFDSRQSFYGKARVIVRDDGTKVLYSYGTPVCRIKDGKATLLRKGYLGWSSSQTTLRHVKEFLKQNGFEIGSYKELAKMYPQEQADINEEYEDLEFTWDSICRDIINKVKEVLNIDITDRDIHYDDSRAYALYVPGSKLGLSCNKFGAYRNYLGGGMRGPIEHNGREQDGTLELGEFFVEQLEKIEDLIASEYEQEESLEESKTLHENEEVNLNNDKEVKDAVDKIEKEEKEEPTEQIIDADADTIDKVADSYIGNAILICNKCRNLFFKKPEELKKDETSGLFNVGDACPKCGNEEGFELGGQVADMSVNAEESEEPPAPAKEETEIEVKEEEPKKERKLTPIEVEDEEKFESFKKVENLDDESFDKLINEYLQATYENVDSYKTTDGQILDEGIELDGTIKYKSGKEKEIKFVFESLSLTKGNKFKLVGMSEALSNSKDAYTIIATIKNDCILCESLSCNYKVNLNESEKIVRGRYSLNSKDKK